MTKKHFIALADALIGVRERVGRAYNDGNPYTDAEVETMYEWAVADVCKQSNPRFNRERWLGYIHGECGPNGGKRK